MPDDPSPVTDPVTPATPVPPEVPAAPAAVALLEPVKVLTAVSDPVRYAILVALRDGLPLAATALGARLGKPQDTISKHLKVLRDARVVMAVESPDGDGRKSYHEIPSPFLKKDAAGRTLLDFGTVLFRL